MRSLIFSIVICALAFSYAIFMFCKASMDMAQLSR